MYINSKGVGRVAVIPYSASTSAAVFQLILLTVYFFSQPTMANDKLFISKRVVLDNAIKPAGILTAEGKIKQIILGDDFDKYKNESVQV